MAHPSTEKRGGNPDIKKQPAQGAGARESEKKLEQGLEESMVGSDPVSVTQPAPGKPKGRH
ncbi:hypothetical protein [Pseudorhodoplanes sp.]|uniref:hypothetical protein n=1 Tax=Pseudorhodoplanes sp. TaxID=1934341 RepID=UPI002BEA07D2|nr:hypothetical protein [Pseudorhodoplanes sp.]HWV51935.1 hypothetical protein [Pseudorhodoplanes sp.]